MASHGDCVSCFSNLSDHDSNHHLSAKMYRSIKAAALATMLLLSGLPSAQGFSTSTGFILPKTAFSLNRPMHTDYRRRNRKSSSPLPSLPNKPLSSSSSQTSSSTSMDSSISTTMPQSPRSASDTQDYQWTKQNLAIALPALMGLLADPVLSMIDTGFVGRVGPIDLAALGVCTSIFNMAFTIFRASTVATTSLVGSAETQEDKRQIAKISLQLGGILGTVVLLTLRLGGPALLATMGVASDSPMFQPACDYLFARC